MKNLKIFSTTNHLKSYYAEIMLQSWLYIWHFMQLYVCIRKNKVLLFYFLLKNISGNQYSTCTLLDCIENEINWKWIYIKSPRYFHKIFAKKLWEINSVISILEFREINVFITELHYKLISRNFFQVCINFVFCLTTSQLV